MAGLSPDLLAGIRRRIRWTASVCGVRLQDDAIDDLAQDLLLRLWERERCAASEVEDFPAYALRAASNLAVDALRRSRTKKRTAPTETTDEGAVFGAPWPLTPEQIAIGRDSLRHQLAECRRVLSARQFQLFALIYLAGFSPREVSKRVGLSPGNVHALLASLRRALGGKGVVIRTRVSRSEREAREDPLADALEAVHRSSRGGSPAPPRNPRDFRAPLVDDPARSPVATGLMNKAGRESPPQPRPGGKP